MSSSSIANTGLNHPTEVYTRAPNYVNALLMTLASSAAVVPIVAGAAYLRLSGNQDFFVTFGTTGATTGGSTVGAASEFVAKDSGLLRNIGGGTTSISVISTAAACTVTQSWWTV